MLYGSFFKHSQSDTYMETIVTSIIFKYNFFHKITEFAEYTTSVHDGAHNVLKRDNLIFAGLPETSTPTKTEVFLLLLLQTLILFHWAKAYSVNIHHFVFLVNLLCSFNENKAEREREDV